MEVQLDLSGGRMRRRPTLLTQLGTQKLDYCEVTNNVPLHPGVTGDTADKCGSGVLSVLPVYLLVALRVMLSDRPGSGSDHPAPHPLSVLLRDAASDQAFELR